MKIFMRLGFSVLLFVLSFSSTSNAQSVLNPADPLVTYNASNPPTEPPFGQIGKWVRTVRLGWNTTPYKAYIYKGIAFRLKFPKTYNHTAVDGKKYPMMVFFHGLGEAGPKTDNEYQLYHGGDYFRISVDNGNYDGYVLFLQSTGFWGAGYYDLVKEIIDYMVINNKLDAFRVTDNGLSAGGSATWEMFINHPSYIAAALPMSAVSIGYKEPPVVEKVKFTPFWNIHGGRDGSPAQSTAEQVRDAMLAAGGNYKNLMYPNLGHGTWNQTWNEPDFWPFMLRAYAANPWPLFGRTEFCPTETINVTIGLAPGFDEYQWRKDGAALPTATNSIQATAPGVYDARVRRGTLWSEWSKVPVHIKIKAATVSPNITVSGNASRVLPSLDGSTTVKLEVPAGYVSYDWQREGEPTTLSTTRFLTVAQPGSYKVKVTEQFGCSSNFSQLFKVIDANGTPKPDPATNVLATTASKTSVRLDWNSNPTPQENEIGFEIYQATQAGGPYQVVGVTTADVVSYTVTGLHPNTGYYYRVRAIGNFGASVASNEAFAKTFSDNIAPTAPGNLKIVDVTQNSVSLAWTASADDVAVTKYELYINGVKSYITTETQFLVSGLETNTSYVFKIIARDFAGNASPSSNQVSVTPRFGLNYKYYTYTGSWGVIQNLATRTPAATGKMQNIALTPRTQNDNFAFLWEGYIKIPVTGTYYFRTNSDDGSKLYLGALGGTTSPYNHTATAVVNNDGLHGPQDATSSPVNLVAGVYPIAITFYEEGGGEVMTVSWKTPETNNVFVSIPNIVFCDQPTSITVLGKPTNFTATPVSYQRIDLSWMDNSNNETGFEISRSTSMFSNFAVVKTTAANATSYQDTGLVANYKYYYKIRAVNQTGESAYDLPGQGVDYSYYQQNGLNALPNFDALTPVKTGRMPNFDLGVQDRVDGFQMKYSTVINIPTAGLYTFYLNSDDGSRLYIDGFTSTHLKIDNDGAHGPVELSKSLQLTKGPHTLIVTYFEGGAGETLEVKMAGPGLIKQRIPDLLLGTPHVNATTLSSSAAPSMPGNLLASGTSVSTTRITWQDNTTNEAGFEVQRSANNGVTYLPLVSLPANTTNYTDAGLFANAVYYYRVRTLGIVNHSGFTPADTAKTWNSIPVITDIVNRTARYGATTTITVKASDIDGDVLTFSGLNLPSFIAIANNGDRTATLTINPTAAQQGVYSNVGVIVKDPNGGADTTIFNLTVNDNYDPVITTITDKFVNENQNIIIPISATDQNAGNSLSLSVSGVPNAYTFTPGSNGNATLSITPTYASSGVHVITVNVTDGNGGMQTTSFNLTVTGVDPNLKLYLRFQGQNSIGAPWNNLTSAGGSNLLDVNNQPTGVGLNMIGNGVTGSLGPIGNGTGVYPDAVLRDFYYFGTSWLSPTVTAVVTGLKPAQKYDFTFYAGSSWNIAPDNGTTTYTIGGQTVSLYVHNNIHNTVNINNVAPAADGTVTISLAKTPASPAGYLNAIVVNSIYVDGTLPQSPTSLNAQYVSGEGVKLNWTDNAYNETGVEVYRSATLAGPYNLLQTVGGGNTTVYTDNSAAGNSLYFYKVRAINAAGSSAYSNTVSLTTSNRVPQIEAIANVVLLTNQSTSVNVIVADDASDVITITASGLPPFATLTDNGNGTGVINIQPNAGSAGEYKGIVVTAKDSRDSSRSTSFDISIVDQNVTSVYLNFTDAATAGKPWNNLVNPQYAGTTYGSLKDDRDVTTSITVNMQDGFEWTTTSGMQPRNGKEIYPEPVMRTGVFESSTLTKRVLVSGLSTTRRYNFVFFNSRDDGRTGVTNFVINGTTVSLDAGYNINQTVQINGVQPNASGEVTINVTKATGNDFAFLNSLIIQSYDPVAIALVSPTGLTVTGATRTSVKLQWQDRSNNETGFEIWRANDGSSSYSLVGSVAAGVTSYTHTGLAANKAYYYTVKAKLNTTSSAFSNVANANTYAYSVYINYNNTNVAATPWNNTNAVPQQGYSWNNFKDETGFATSLGMNLLTPWAGLYGGGINTTNNSGIYPDNVMIESYGLFPGEVATFKITGLNIQMKYNFTFFASSTDTRDVTSSYTINGRTSFLNASLNKKGNVTMYDVVADENGEVLITVSSGTVTSQFGLIGALIIDAFKPAVGTAPLPSEAAPQAFVMEAITDVQEREVVSKLYPNPFRQYFTMAVTAEENERMEIIMYDVSGKLVYQNKFAGLFKGVNTVRVQPAKLAPGFYVVTMILGNRRELKQFKVIKE